MRGHDFVRIARLKTFSDDAEHTLLFELRRQDAGKRIPRRWPVSQVRDHVRHALRSPKAKLGTGVLVELSQDLAPLRAVFQPFVDELVSEVPGLLTCAGNARLAQFNAHNVC